MKLLVFESGMMKNLDYDIGSVSQQVQEVKPDEDITKFIQTNAGAKTKLVQQAPYANNSMAARTLQKLLNKHTYSRFEFEVGVRWYLEKEVSEGLRGVHLQVDYGRDGDQPLANQYTWGGTSSYPRNMQTSNNNIEMLAQSVA